MEILKKIGIKTASYTTIKNEKEIRKKIRKIKFPAVLKVISKQVTHKTEIGGVILGIKNQEELSKAVMDLRKKLTNKVRIEKFMVQEYVEGFETIIGIKKDEIFGQVVVFGIGGKFTELFKDISIRVCPIDYDEAMEMIKEIKGYSLLKGFRGSGANLNEIANTISKISKFAIRKNVLEMDINPFIVNEKEGKAVDARILFK
ncbi:MAG: acetate--CoA ligase family protein [Candidatus Parvarchaeota archaeon]|nr:acetate--CoA ligase family protein [Candidatus Jingweiarchaeum tengchongense]